MEQAREHCPKVIGCGEPSCVGFCGQQSPGECFCDDFCCDFADCCYDKEWQCGGAHCIDPGDCYLHCGANVFSCSCHPDCVHFGSCCANICEHCPEFAQCPVYNPADLTGDNVVNGRDLVELLSQWGPCPGYGQRCPNPEACPADFVGPGNTGPDVKVNGLDLVFLLSNWGSVGCGDGWCCMANGSPGCQNHECCDIICELLPSCCTEEWTAQCAIRANTFCPSCGGTPPR